MTRRGFAWAACVLGALLVTWPMMAMAAPTITKTTLGIAGEGETVTKPTAAFAPDTPAIRCVWALKGVTGNTAIGGVWIAEDVGKVAPPNYKIGQTSKTLPADGHGTFTLSKPTHGFPVGKYRLEIYLNQQLTKIVRFTVGAQ